MPRLENWSVISDFDPFKAPELQAKRLEGEIYDDEKCRFPDGSEVTTSRLVKLDLNSMIAQTRNTGYVLGKMSDSYVEWLDFNKVDIESIVV